ncbi:hypothetical protein AB0N06_22095 [Streptomyces sp. NPDC051020]|uniref:hypothetical protein n=1 Tax=Streptomyces sp. NPDC051020 TaxID=3155409 RepID=UPI00343BC6A9
MECGEPGETGGGERRGVDPGERIAQARQHAASSGGLVITCRASFGFTANRTSDDAQILAAGAMGLLRRYE